MEHEDRKQARRRQQKEPRIGKLVLSDRKAQEADADEGKVNKWKEEQVAQKFEKIFAVEHEVEQRLVRISPGGPQD
jgi:hypothetical protein